MRKTTTWEPSQGQGKAHTHTTRRTTRSPDWGRDVLTPMGQSILIASGVTIGSTVIIIPIIIWQKWPAWLIFSGLGLGGLTYGLSSILLVLDHRRLLWGERVTSVEFDTDTSTDRPALPPPDPEPAIIHVHDPYREARIRWSNDFRFFVDEAYGNRGTTWEAWEGTKLPSGNTITQKLWERFCQQLLDAGLAVRPYATATLDLQSTRREAYETLRELL